MLLGLLILITAAVLLNPLESWIHKHLEGAGDFLAEHIYLPAARVLALIGFLFAVYPSPFFDAHVLQAIEPSRLGTPPIQSLMNWLFAIGLLIPLLPQTEKFSGLILPIQALIGAWMLIAAAGQSIAAHLVLANPAQILMTFFTLVIASHFVLRWLAKRLAERQRWDPLSVYDSLILIAQPPLILIVTSAVVLQ